ncbi:MAG: circadian clock kinase KaiC [Chthonomonadales bacterium]|nr:circadian clock kinase KaiC [Chthonomonadales bacterium]
MLLKCPTGIDGLDDITEGGLPRGRTTLVCGSAGCGKTLLAMEFLVRGAAQYDEPGVFVAFEETAEELTQNVASLGFDLNDLVEKQKVRLDYVRVERSEIEETGEYDLEGLFIRLGYAIDSIGAKRVVLDTIESLFAGLSNTSILRAELRRLFHWLKERGVTTIITGERGEGALTRQGLEEYVSDCVILLDHRVISQMSTRRLRVVKYRGSTHGTNEYPFLIDKDGISVLPITSLSLEHSTSNDRVSTGVPRLDAMLEGKGYYRGCSVLISGTAGTGKSSLAAHFVDAACRRGETCLYFAFEESREQVIRNMRSIGIDLAPWIEQKKLHFIASRPTTYGLEMHLSVMHRQIMNLQPQVVVIDPVSPFLSVGTREEVRAMLTRMLDYLKLHQITALCTNLIYGSASVEATESSVSSVMDTWIMLRDIETGGERNRGLYILKSRGMSHSNQVREFVLTSRGAELLDVYLGPDGVLTGSARIARESAERTEPGARQQALERKKNIALRKRKTLEAQMELLQLQIEAEREDLAADLTVGEQWELQQKLGRAQMAHSRKADPLDPVEDARQDLPLETRGNQDGG